MNAPATRIALKPLEAFVKAVGAPLWRDRIRHLATCCDNRSRTGRQAAQRHILELTIQRLRGGKLTRPATTAERLIAGYVTDALATLEALTPAGRERLLALLRAGLSGSGCLVGPFHLLRTAALQRARGFDVHHAGLDDGAPFDLLISRDGIEAEIACDVLSAEEGRMVHRGAWFNLVDRIDPDLQAWLRAHPGRYLLKMTLPTGLRADMPELLANLHARINAMLASRSHADGDAAAMLRLDPLVLAAASADELGLMPRLRAEFGPEAHLAVTASGGAVFVMAARAGGEDAVAAAVRRRLCALAPTRLTGTRPGILSLFLEDTDRAEWALLREKLLLEGETRQFMTGPEARSVVAVTCASRLELFGMPAPDAMVEGDLRFRNPAHPAAKLAPLAPSILSSM